MTTVDANGQRWVACASHRGNCENIQRISSRFIQQHEIDRALHFIRSIDQISHYGELFCPLSSQTTEN